MSRRQEESLFDLLVEIPWWINFCIGFAILLLSKIIASSSNQLHAAFAPAIQLGSIIFFLVGIVSWIISFLTKKKKNRHYAKTKQYYYEKANLFTKGESAFLKVLDAAVGNNYRVFGKVRIADVITAPKEFYANRSEQTSAFNRIKSKHIDFVLCDPITQQPIIGIELDDKSHDSAENQKRDAIKNEAFELAGIPLLRIKSRSYYGVDDIKMSIIKAAGTRMDDPEIELKKNQIKIPIKKDPGAREVQYKFD